MASRSLALRGAEVRIGFQKKKIQPLLLPFSHHTFFIPQTSKKELGLPINTSSIRPGPLWPSGEELHTCQSRCCFGVLRSGGLWVVSAYVKPTHTSAHWPGHPQTVLPFVVAFISSLSQLFQSCLFPTASFHRIPSFSHSFTFIFSLHFRHLPLLLTPPCVLFSYLSALALFLHSPLSSYLR